MENLKMHVVVIIGKLHLQYWQAARWSTAGLIQEETHELHWQIMGSFYNRYKMLTGRGSAEKHSIMWCERITGTLEPKIGTVSLHCI